MKLSDFNRLKKIMDRTRSENDHEALASLRAANKIIEAAGVSWERFFDRSVRIEYEHSGDVPIEDSGEKVAPPTTEDRRIDEAFEVIREHDERRYERDFIQSLLKQWKDRGWLSDSQKVHLFRNAGEAGERGRR